MQAVYNDFSLLEDYSYEDISEMIYDLLNLDLSENQIEECHLKCYNNGMNYVNLISLGEYSVSVQELIELDKMDDEILEALDFLLNSFRHREDIKNNVINLNSNTFTVKQFRHRVNVLKGKLSKLYDSKYKKENFKKGTRKLVIKCALISLTNNKNII